MVGGAHPTQILLYLNLKINPSILEVLMVDNAHPTTLSKLPKPKPAQLPNSKYSNPLSLPHLVNRGVRYCIRNSCYSHILRNIVPTSPI